MHYWKGKNISSGFTPTSLNHCQSAPIIIDYSSCAALVSTVCVAYCNSCQNIQHWLQNTCSHSLSLSLSHTHTHTRTHAHTHTHTHTYSLPPHAHTRLPMYSGPSARWSVKPRPTPSQQGTSRAWQNQVPRKSHLQMRTIEWKLLKPLYHASPPSPSVAGGT